MSKRYSACDGRRNASPESPSSIARRSDGIAFVMFSRSMRPWLPQFVAGAHEDLGAVCEHEWVDDDDVLLPDVRASNTSGAEHWFSK